MDIIARIKAKKVAEDLQRVTAEGGGTGSLVTNSTTNGNIKVNNVETKVYDDTELQEKAHVHSNNLTLSKLSDNGTNLLFNGDPISGGGGSSLILEDWVPGESVTVITDGEQDTTPPNNVTNLAAINVTQTSLTLSWTASASSDLASYDVYNGASLLGNTASNSYNVTDLTAGTQYTFTVKAKDSSGNVANGTSVTVTTAEQQSEPDTTPPEEVTNLTATPGSTTVDLSWTASASGDVASYEIYNGESLITTVTGTSYQVTGLTAETAYTFTVKAKDTSDNVSAGVSVNTTTDTDEQPIGVNLFNQATVTAGYYVNTTTGELAALAGWNASEYIKLEHGRIYDCNISTGNRAYYDINKIFKANANNQVLFVGSPNRGHIRFSVQDANLATFSIVKSSKINLYDYTTVDTGKALVAASGTLTDTSTYSTSAFIPVTPGATYVLSSGIGYKSEYDSNFAFIQTDTNNVTEFTVGANTHYVKFSLPNTNVQDAYWYLK